MKKITLFILIISILFGIIGCSDNRSFTFAEFTITLPKEYSEMEKNDTYDLTMTNGEAIIGLNRIPRGSAAEAGIPDWLMPKEFADYYMRKAGVDSAVELQGDVPYYIYYNTPIGGEAQFCLAAFYRSQYAYFTLFLIVNAEAERPYIGAFLDYIDNVTLSAIRT